MAEKKELTEEQIAQKMRMRKILSAIFGAIALISIMVFVVLMILTGKNKNTQVAIDTQELRSKMKQIIALERNYYTQSQRLADIRYLALSKELDRFNPNIDGAYRYRFDSRTGLATGMEKEDNDVNNNSQSDGLTLSINWEPGVTPNSAFFWTEEDIADFTQRNAAEPKIEIGSGSNP